MMKSTNLKSKSSKFNAKPPKDRKQIYETSSSKTKGKGEQSGNSTVQDEKSPGFSPGFSVETLKIKPNHSQSEKASMMNSSIKRGKKSKRGYTSLGDDDTPLSNRPIQSSQEIKDQEIEDLVSGLRKESIEINTENVVPINDKNLNVIPSQIQQVHAQETEHHNANQLNLSRDSDKMEGSIRVINLSERFSLPRKQPQTPIINYTPSRNDFEAGEQQSYRENVTKEFEHEIKFVNIPLTDSVIIDRSKEEDSQEDFDPLSNILKHNRISDFEIERSSELRMKNYGERFNQIADKEDDSHIKSDHSADLQNFNLLDDPKRINFREKSNSVHT